MVAVDTNVVVRLLTRDDPEQFERARKVFQQDPLFIADTVLLETEWVLRYAYGFKPAEVVTGMRGILGLPNVRTPEPGRLAKALEWHEDGMDFADALHLAGSQSSDVLFTFDQKFVKRAPAESGCRVLEPS